VRRFAQDTIAKILLELLFDAALQDWKESLSNLDDLCGDVDKLIDEIDDFLMERQVGRSEPL
jgi:hypothetical protein